MQHLNVATVQKQGDFFVSANRTSVNFVLDVPFDKRVPGTENIPMAVISFDNASKNKERLPARLFAINTNGTISPTASPHLVLGVRNGAALLRQVCTGHGIVTVV